MPSHLLRWLIEWLVWGQRHGWVTPWLQRLEPLHRWCSLRLQCEHQRLRGLGALLQASAVVMVV